jgi:hypothetical protein
VKTLGSLLIKLDRVLIGGELNFTLGACDIWGPLAQIDPLDRIPNPQIGRGWYI